MEEQTEKQEVAKKPKISKQKLVIGAVVVLLAASTGIGYKVYADNGKLDQQITEASNLVLYNPLAKGESSKKLQELLPKAGEVKNDKFLRGKVKKADLSSLIKKAQDEINEERTKQEKTQKESLTTVQNKLNEMKKNKHFPENTVKEITQLEKLATGFEKKQDIVGMNVSIAGLQALAGETTTFIQEKTKEQKAREEKEKQEAEAKKHEQEADAKSLADAVANETYPSLGALRGDIANGGGVIPMKIYPDGPADNAGFETADSEWADSSVIVEIDGKKVSSAVIGDNSMENVLKGIKLGKKVNVKFKDGSSKKVELTLPFKEAAKYRYPDLPSFGNDTDSDLYFGVSGYNMGQHNGNKELGLYITDIYSGSSVSSSSLQKGDIICRIDGYYIGDATDIKKVMSRYYDGDTVTVDYVSKEGHLKSTEVTLIEE